jgi:hypothetical protein
MPCPAAVMNAIFPASLPLIQFLLVWVDEKSFAQRIRNADLLRRNIAYFPLRNRWFRQMQTTNWSDHLTKV